MIKQADLDIDSDHTTDFGGPQRDDFEDSIEEGVMVQGLSGSDLRRFPVDSRSDEDALSSENPANWLPKWSEILIKTEPA